MTCLDFRFKFQCPLCEVKYKSRSGFNSHRKLHVDRVENGDIDSIKRESVIQGVPLTTNSVTTSTRLQYTGSPLKRVWLQYIGSRLKRVWLEHHDHYLKCNNVWLQPAPAYNEHFLLHILLVVSEAQCTVITLPFTSPTICLKI